MSRVPTKARRLSDMGPRAPGRGGGGDLSCERRCGLSADLLDAVSAFLLREARPATADKVVGYKLLVVSHLLGGLARELRDAGAGEAADEARHAALLGLPVPAEGEAGAVDRQRLRAHLLHRILEPTTPDKALDAILDAQLDTLAEQLLLRNPFFDRSLELDGPLLGGFTNPTGG